MRIEDYLDSTYLKTPEQSGLSEEQTWEKVKELTDEAMQHRFFAVMIRPQYVKKVKEIVDQQKSPVKVGTVIDFPLGNGGLAHKIDEATKALDNGADELDFVLNYEAYLKGDLQTPEKEFIDATALCLKNGKVAKWIIEIAALTDIQIADVTELIRDWAIENFDESDFPKIFVKSSTGFFPSKDGKPNGATFEGIQFMLDNAGQLPVKAAGGVRTHDDAVKMIEMGVKRIGTSSALSLIK